MGQQAERRDRKFRKLTNGPIPLSCESNSVGSIKLLESYNREKEKESDKEKELARQSTCFQACIQPNHALPIASRTCLKPENTPTISSPWNDFEFECVGGMRILARATKLRPLLIHWFKKGWIHSPKGTWALGTLATPSRS